MASNRPKNALRIIFKLFVLYKVLQLFIIYFVPSQFDNSSEIIKVTYEKDGEEFVNCLTEGMHVPNFVGEVVMDILNKFVTWDAVYFTELFVNGIKYEHEFVFAPLWWRLIKAVPIGGQNFYVKLCWGIAIANICHFLSCVVLYYLSLKIFTSNTLFISRAERIALLSSLFYVISPAGVFLTAPYSESLCSLLCFSALLLRELSMNRSSYNNIYSKTCLKPSIIYKLVYIFSGSLISLAFGVRANSLLFGILYLYDFYEFTIRNKSFKDSVLSILAGSQLMAAFLFANLFAYKTFCPARGEWCFERIPSLFSYAQSHYWNTGFLSYWSLQNIPNFLFAFPTVFLSTQAIKFFTFDNPMKCCLPISIVNFFLLVGGIFWWHVQILTRISSCLPLMYWFCAALYSSNYPFYSKLGEYCLKYFIIWGLVQTGLFASFLPPA